MHDTIPFEQLAATVEQQLARADRLHLESHATTQAACLIGDQAEQLERQAEEAVTTATKAVRLAQDLYPVSSAKLQLALNAYYDRQRAQHRGEAVAAVGVPMSGAVVPPTPDGKRQTVELARRELEKALELGTEEHWRRAAEQLLRALAL